MTPEAQLVSATPNLHKMKSTSMFFTMLLWTRLFLVARNPTILCSFFLPDINERVQNIGWPIHNQCACTVSQYCGTHGEKKKPRNGSENNKQKFGETFGSQHCPPHTLYTHYTHWWQIAWAVWWGLTDSSWPCPTDANATFCFCNIHKHTKTHTQKNTALDPKYATF